MSDTLYLANHDGGILRCWCWLNRYLPDGAGIVILAILATIAISLGFIFWGARSGQFNERAAWRMFEFDEEGKGEVTHGT